MALSGSHGTKVCSQWTYNRTDDHVPDLERPPVSNVTYSRHSITMALARRAPPTQHKQLSSLINDSFEQQASRTC